MSARRLDSSVFLAPVTLHSPAKRLELPASAVRIHKNGIEFRSDSPFNPWTEMTVVLETSATAKKLQCTGVVVECRGNRHQGYHVSMLFTDLTAQAQARLQALAFSGLA